RIDDITTDFFDLRVLAMPRKYDHMAKTLASTVRHRDGSVSSTICPVSNDGVELRRHYRGCHSSNVAVHVPARNIRNIDTGTDFCNNCLELAPSYSLRTDIKPGRRNTL